MADPPEFEADLFHDGIVKTVNLPRPEEGEPPPRVRVGAVDSGGNRVIDVFLLSDASGWPARVGYRYVGSIPARP